MRVRRGIKVQKDPGEFESLLSLRQSFPSVTDFVRWSQIGLTSLRGDVKILYSRITKIGRETFCTLVLKVRPEVTKNYFERLLVLSGYYGMHRGLPFSTYAPRGGGGVQVFYTFPLRIICKKGVGGSR